MMTCPSLIPEKWKKLDGSVLKMIAVISMLIDHTAAVLMRGDTTILIQIGGFSLSLYTFMRSVGRLAFPLYAFLLTEGYIHTKNRLGYALRLLAFALISEIPWNLEHTGTLLYAGQNVFFTLFLGLVGIWLMDEFIKDGSKRIRNALLLIVLFVISMVLKADYGVTGYAFILMMYLLREMPIGRALVGSAFLSSGWLAGLAYIPIAFYNGERGFIKGKAASLCFYALYPVHMLILYLIRLSTIGY